MLNSKVPDSTLWGVVLAGGSGTRLKSFTRSFYNHERPKQYCAFIGSRSMAQHTLDRIKLHLKEDRILTVVSKKHLQFVREQFPTFSKENLIVQPFCRETAPAILLPVLEIHHRDPNAIVALFPSDHFILDEAKFMKLIQKATMVVEKHPDRIVTLGVRPDRIDHGYGWIKQGERVDAGEGFEMYEVHAFVEKPQQEFSAFSEITEYFWNTLVVVGTSATMLNHFQNHTPQLFDACSILLVCPKSRREFTTINTFYNEIETTNFSKMILEQISQSLYVIDATDVYWNDWGEEHRIRQDVERFNYCLNGMRRIELAV